GVVGNDELKAGRSFDRLAGLVDRENASMVRQRVQHDDRVLAGLHHFIEVANRALAHGARQRPVLPHRSIVPNEEATNQIAGSQIVVTRYRHERTPQSPRHVLDETGLAASRRALEHHAEIAGMTTFEIGRASCRESAMMSAVAE